MKSCDNNNNNGNNKLKHHVFTKQDEKKNHSGVSCLHSDNTASVLTQRGGFLQRDQLVHFLPVVISDGGNPSLTSTNTLSITICECDLRGNRRFCSRVMSPLIVVGLNAAATALTCILTLLGTVIFCTVILYHSSDKIQVQILLIHGLKS